MISYEGMCNAMDELDTMYEECHLTYEEYNRQVQMLEEEYYEDYLYE